MPNTSAVAAHTDAPAAAPILSPKATSSSIPDFAGRHGVAVSTVWQWIRDGRLKVVRLGPRATRITGAEEARFLAESAGK